MNSKVFFEEFSKEILGTHMLWYNQMHRILYFSKNYCRVGVKTEQVLAKEPTYYVSYENCLPHPYGIWL